MQNRPDQTRPDETDRRTWDRDCYRDLQLASGCRYRLPVPEELHRRGTPVGRRTQLGVAASSLRLPATLGLLPLRLPPPLRRRTRTAALDEFFFTCCFSTPAIYARATAVWSGLMRARAASTIQLALYRLNRNRSLVRSFVALCRGRRGGLASCRWRCGALHPRQQQQQHHRHLSIDFLVLVHNLWSVLLALRRRNDVMYVRVF